MCALYGTADAADFTGAGRSEASTTSRQRRLWPGTAAQQTAQQPSRTGSRIPMLLAAQRSAGGRAAVLPAIATRMSMQTRRSRQ